MTIVTSDPRAMDLAPQSRALGVGLMCGHAVDVILGDVRIVSDYPDTNDEVVIAKRDDRFPRGVGTRLVSIKDLTLAPTVLEDEKDYQKAPEGTVVLGYGKTTEEMSVAGVVFEGAEAETCVVYVKEADKWYATHGTEPLSSEAMSGVQRKVLVWRSNA